MLNKIEGTEKSWLAYALIVLAVAVGCFIRIGQLNTDETDRTIRTPDEAMYTAYASVIAHEGVSGVAISVREYNKNQKLWLLPPPTRVSYLFLLASAMKSAGRFDLAVGIVMSCIISIMTLMLVAVFCLRFFGPWIAGYSCLFIAVSPMELILANKVWQDSLMTFLGGALIFISCEIVRCRNKFIMIPIFGLLGVITILVKESGILIFALAGLFLVFWLVQQRARAAAGYLMAVMMCAVGISGSILISVSGGWEPLKELYGHLREAVSINTYALQMQNGPWYSNVVGFFILSPAITLLCFAGILITLKKFRDSKSGVYLFLAILFISFVVIASWPAYFKNLRYLSPVYIPFYALAGFAFSLGLKALRKILRRPALVALSAFMLMGALACLDLWTYQRIFIQGHAKDLVNPLLARIPTSNAFESHTHF